MNENAIKEALQKGERVTLECKLAKAEVPKSIWETYSAFANTIGGLVLLGIEEHKKETDLAKRFEIIGVDNAEKIRKDFWNTVNSPEKVNVNLLKDEDVEIVEIDGKKIVAVKVPRADYTIRPVYINNNLLRGTFIRNHEGDYHCPEQTIRMMVRDTFQDGNDRLFLKHYTMDDIDIPTLERYRNHFKSRYPQHVFNSLDHTEFLRQFGGFAMNREEGVEGLTMAGLLMFGKGLPVRERFDNLRLDYIDKSNLIGDQRYSDRLTYDGTWENNLFNFVTMVLPKLLRDLPRPFKMEGVERDDDTPQHKAVREAMTNAIIHADLMVDGVLKVEKYDNKFVFTNPGLLKLPVEQIYAGEETKARNQRIQNMLRMIGFGENLGSGFPLILSAWNEKHWLKPELIEQPELLQVKLVLSIEEKENNSLVPKDGTKDGIKELTDNQKEIIELIIQDGTITSTVLAQKTGLSQRTLMRELATLKKNGVLTREGGRKNGHWIVL